MENKKLVSEIVVMRSFYKVCTHTAMIQTSRWVSGFQLILRDAQKEKFSMKVNFIDMENVHSGVYVNNCFALLCFPRYRKPNFPISMPLRQ
jgi:hypothetical protein